MKRKIAAILAADVVGYSRMMSEDEDGTLRRLLADREIFADLVGRGHGRIFNTAGDAVLAEFPSAIEGLRAAIAIQEAIRERNLACPPARQMRFRIGMTIGDVVERDGDLLGEGVNIAARLEGLAEPGGICVSRNVHEQVGTKIAVTFRDIGPQAVKNIATPIHAFAIAPLGGPSPAALVAGPVPVRPEQREIVAERDPPPRRRAPVGRGVAALVLLGACGVAGLWLHGRPATREATHEATHGPSTGTAAQRPARPVVTPASTTPRDVTRVPTAPAAGPPEQPAERSAAIAPDTAPEAATEPETATRACDRLAAAPFDRENPDGMAGVAFEAIDAAAAVPACRAALSMRPGNAHVEMELGRALQKQHATEAFEHYRLAVQAGDSAAMDALGQAYETGSIGLPRDPVRAAQLYADAVEAGNPSAMRHLGALYRAGIGVAPDQARADELAERARSLETAAAQPAP